MSKFRDQTGVAMITVMLVGASLTAVVSVAAFSTIHEFRSQSDDRQATGALAYAEAGVDRFMHYLKSGNATFNNLNSAGCNGFPALTLPTGTIGDGTYDASLTVYNPDAPNPADRMPPQACVGRGTNPNAFNAFFQITSTGRDADASRTVRQIALVEPIDLPIGLFGNSFDANGSPNLISISMIARGTVSDRGKLDFGGNDPYYLMRDFFPGGVSGRSPTDPMPAAAHSAGALIIKNKAEFPPLPNCNGNKTNGITQSLWDSDSNGGTVASGCSGQSGFPLSNLFTTADLARFKTTLTEEDHQGLKQAAQSAGVYCSFPGQGGSGSTTCTKRGVSVGSNWSTAVQQLPGEGVRNFVAYFEYRAGTASQNNLGWGPSVWPCNDDPNLNTSIVIVVRRGGFDLSGNAQINGAVIVDGHFDYTGNPTVQGTVMADEFRVRGNAAFQNSACWVRNMPGPFWRVVPGQWSEIDR